MLAMRFSMFNALQQLRPQGELEDAYSMLSTKADEMKKLRDELTKKDTRIHSLESDLRVAAAEKETAVAKAQVETMREVMLVNKQTPPSASNIM